MRADGNLQLLSALPPQPAQVEAILCRESLHRTLAHFVACQRAWLPLLLALQERKARASVKTHPLRLMEAEGLTSATWADLLREYQQNVVAWNRCIDKIDPESRVQVAHRTWTAEELTLRLIKHERHHLAEHKMVTPE